MQISLFRESLLRNAFRQPHLSKSCSKSCSNVCQSLAPRSQVTKLLTNTLQQCRLCVYRLCVTVTHSRHLVFDKEKAMTNGNGPHADTKQKPKDTSAEQREKDAKKK